MVTGSSIHVGHPSGFEPTVAANIRAEAARRGLLQKDLGRYLGLAPSRISERWHGRTPWTLQDIERLAELFGCSPQSLCAAPADCVVPS